MFLVSGRGLPDRRIGGLLLVVGGSHRGGVDQVGGEEHHATIMGVDDGEAVVWGLLGDVAHWLAPWLVGRCPVDVSKLTRVSHGVKGKIEN